MSIISFFVIFYILTKNLKKKNIPSIPNSFTILLSSLVVLFIGLFPKENSADKRQYAAMFNNINEITPSKDIGWYYYVYLLNKLLHIELFFFFVTALLYLTGYYFFYKSIISKQYLFYIFLATFGSLGFLAYGVNTIRAGLSLSLLLFSFSKKNNKMLFLILITISPLIHKSILLIATALIITNFIKKSNFYLFIWLFAFVISSMNINLINDISNLFSEVDSRVGQYMTLEKNELYIKSGFRLDFIVYSLYPILLGYYYIFISGFKDAVYKRLFNTYILLNAFWLLVIRIPYGDRFAYLSWFLLPFLITYPLLSFNKIKNKKLKLSFSILLIISVNLLIILKSYI